MKQFIQHSPPHPGKILRELYLEPMGLTVTEAAEKLDITRPNLSLIVNGKAGISASMALKLGKQSKYPAEYWMILQMNYDLYQAKLMKE
jgi:addiction module HigA family antidote